MPSFCCLNDQGRNSRQVLRLQKACSDNLIFRATLPILGMECSNVPCCLRNPKPKP